MRYSFKPCFVLVHVAGAHIVVSLRDAWGKYPMVIQLADESACIWENVEKDTPEEDIVSELIQVYGLTEEQAKKTYSQFIRFCLKYGYFLPEEAE